MRGGGVSRRWKIVAACCLCQKRQASSTARIPAHTTMIPAGFSCKDSVFFLFVVFSSVSMWAWQVSDRLSTGSQFSFAFPFAHRGKKIVGMRRKNGAAKKNSTQQVADWFLGADPINESYQHSYARALSYVRIVLLWTQWRHKARLNHRRIVFVYNRQYGDGSLMDNKKHD